MTYNVSAFMFFDKRCITDHYVPNHRALKASKVEAIKMNCHSSLDNFCRSFSKKNFLNRKKNLKVFQRRKY